MCLVKAAVAMCTIFTAGGVVIYDPVFQETVKQQMLKSPKLQEMLDNPELMRGNLVRISSQPGMPNIDVDTLMEELRIGAANKGAKAMQKGSAVTEKHVLTYFPLAGGRGEAVRIALFTAKIPFEDQQMPFQEYQEKKKAVDDNAWKNGLPVLTIGDRSYSQSLAMLRYAGKKAGLYPTDDLMALAVDEVMDVSQDILTKCPQDPVEEVKKAKRQEYAAGKMAALFDVLAQRVTEAGSGFTVGPDLTIGDLCVYFMLKMLRDGMFDHVASDYTDKWPCLAALENKVAEHPVMKAYNAGKA
eukprot:gnl/TRDRNA2_/TRDRNA2_168083_c0_seq2.p1 gnl/TRDRNA2_/TRDRNA2_168083_c0~~gnl/TRDRNA2_/TRDRNA2_168083_c0_seq2.p1  ORF type:complete len:300 (+),score=78.62 gnl/TRDRNA2_/TRDRNA2_168083_c0_seq2:34-933(+)